MYVTRTTVHDEQIEQNGGVRVPSDGLDVDDVDVSDAPDSSVLLLLAVQAAPDEASEDFSLLPLGYVVDVHALGALGDIVLVDGSPVHVTVVLLGPPVVGAVVREGGGVNRRLSPRPRRSEISERGTDPAHHRRALRTGGGRLLVPLRFALCETERSTQRTLKPPSHKKSPRDC
jgi:hypothetical protein